MGLSHVFLACLLVDQTSGLMAPRRLVPHRGATRLPLTTSSGLEYDDTVVGEGAAPNRGDFVSVHYTGRLKGDVFDSSYGRNQADGGLAKTDKPLEFVLGKGTVIPGWDEGISTMRVGGKRTLKIPPALGYGQQGTPDGVIPPGATLTFDVELVSVNSNSIFIDVLAKGLQFAVGLVALNGVAISTTGHELREYLQGTV